MGGFMRLKNKKTGEIGEVGYLAISDGKIMVISINYQDELYEYNSLAELNAEWEDYEEPKEWYWFIEDNGIIQRSCHYEDLHPTLDNARKQIGNYFKTKEEAEKAVEKLKACKRLKDKGFRFTWAPTVGSLDINPEEFQIEINADMPAKWFCCDAVKKDLDDCFGGEE